MLGAPVTTIPPTGELITLDSAKSFLRIDGDTTDIEVEMLRDAAIGQLEQLTGLRLLSQTVAVRADQFADLAHFRVGPIAAVTSIAYVDAAGDGQVMATEDYELFGAPLEQGIALTAALPTARSGSIVVTLEVGYGESASDVPATLRYAVFALMREKFEGEPVDLDPLINDHRFWL